jgi:hypothetical protein
MATTVYGVGTPLDPSTWTGMVYTGGGRARPARSPF